VEKPIIAPQLFNSGFVVSPDMLQSDARLLAEHIHSQWPGTFRKIVGISRGGLVPAVIIARELDIRVVETLSIKTYNKFAVSEPAVVKMPALEFLGENSYDVLVVDDLVDTGATFVAARTMMPHARFVAVYAKPQGLPHTDMYVRDVPQDIWIHLLNNCIRSIYKTLG